MIAGRSCCEGSPSGRLTPRGVRSRSARAARRGPTHKTLLAGWPRAGNGSLGGEVVATRAVPAGSVAELSQQSRTWEWKGHEINHLVFPGSATPVVLVHGFGASVGHWRRNIPALVDQGHEVHAIDLLGFGSSDKPASHEYTMEGWRDLVKDYLAAFLPGRPAVLMGNSIGSLVAVLAAADSPSGVKGLVLCNCAGGMNNTATLDDDWRIKLLSPVIYGINALLSIPQVASFLFDKFRTKENVEGVLRSVYGNQGAVDEELVDLIHTPSCDQGALDAFVSIITGPPGPRPEPAIERVQAPILLIWGSDDPFTPIDGPVGKFFAQLPSGRPGTTLEMVPGAGHCPHDDMPEEVHKTLLPWLQGL